MHWTCQHPSSFSQLNSDWHSAFSEYWNNTVFLKHHFSIFTETNKWHCTWFWCLMFSHFLQIRCCYSQYCQRYVQKETQSHLAWGKLRQKCSAMSFWGEIQPHWSHALLGNLTETKTLLHAMFFNCTICKGNRVQPRSPNANHKSCENHHMQERAKGRNLCHYWATPVAGYDLFLSGPSRMLLLLPGTVSGIYLIPWKPDLEK